MGVMHERVMSLIPGKRGGVKEFAANIGVPANLVSMWRKGDSVSYKNYLPQIARAYNVSIDWLCGSEQKEKSPAPEGAELTPEQIKAIEKIKNMSPDELARKMPALVAVLDM